MWWKVIIWPSVLFNRLGPVYNDISIIFWFTQCYSSSIMYRYKTLYNTIRWSKTVRQHYNNIMCEVTLLYSVLYLFLKWFATSVPLWIRATTGIPWLIMCSHLMIPLFSNTSSYHLLVTLDLNILSYFILFIYFSNLTVTAVICFCIHHHTYIHFLFYHIVSKYNAKEIVVLSDHIQPAECRIYTAIDFLQSLLFGFCDH